MSAQIKVENFEEIYKQTYNNVLKFIVVKCNNIDDINDVLQDTYIELFNKIKKEKIINIENINSYIFGICNNILKRHYHRRKKENIISFYNDDESENEEIIGDNFDLEQDFITKENVAKVWQYVKNKDLITSKIFYLYFVLGLKISEISSELNTNESNIKNKIYRTLKDVKKFIEKEVS